MELDFTYIDEISGKDIEFRNNLISTFVDELIKDSKQVSEAYDSNNKIKLNKVLHKLKYKFNLFKANKLVEIVETIEKNITIKESDKILFLNLFEDFTCQISKQLT